MEWQQFEASISNYKRKSKNIYPYKKQKSNQYHVFISVFCFRDYVMHNYIMFTVFGESTPFTIILNTNKAVRVNTTLVSIFKM